jgi:tRNA(His) guanylyltransferase
MKDDLGKRMKTYYEDRFRFKLLRRTYTIIRIDGKAFHTYTKGMERPFDSNFISVMNEVALKLVENIEGAKCAYVQSDEISLIITDFDNIGTDAFFDNNLQKLCSVSSSMATAYFNQVAYPLFNKIGIFDSRVFQLPCREEVFNYLIWRQKDATRNSVQSCAQSKFSHSELNHKNVLQQKQMLNSVEFNWDNLDDTLKYGRIITKDACVGIDFLNHRWYLKNLIPDNSL